MTELQENWLQALESGKYEQGNGVLRDSNNRYCCLGVACEVCGLIATPTDCAFSSYLYDGEVAMAPLSIIEKLGLFDCFGSSFANGDSLVHLNDSGKSFKQIAAIVRKNPAAYFKLDKNHKLGWTESNLSNLIGASFETFKEHMHGQTCGLTDDGEVIYYENDVVKYLARYY